MAFCHYAWPAHLARRGQCAVNAVLHSESDALHVARVTPSRLNRIIVIMSAEIDGLIHEKRSHAATMSGERAIAHELTEIQAALEK